MADEQEAPPPEEPEGPQLGSFITRVTKALGFQPCHDCRKRAEFLDQLSKKVYKRVRRR